MTAVDDVLTAALTYAGRGWRVLPIRPGKKSPPMDEWQRAATTDGELIRQWWRQWPRHGVGIATGGASGFFVIDIDISDGKNGDETLDDLEATYGPLPPTAEVVTGSGGRHLYFAWPEGANIRNDASVRLGPGIDIRGEGGQVLAPPTRHPSGTHYTWEASSDPSDGVALAQPPKWLVDLLTKAPDAAPRAERIPYVGDPRPGDRFAASVTWPDILRADGATFMGERVDHRSGHRYELWARPGVDDHAGATLYYSGSDVLKVFSSAWPGLTQDQTYTRFGYFVATRYGGDFARAAGDLRARQSVEEVERWALIESTPVAATGEASEPTEGPKTLAVRWVDVLATEMPDEPPEIIEGMLRAGEFCVIGAPRAVGKTWIGMNIAVLLAEGEGRLFGRLEVKRRARVLYLQGELDEWGSARRWTDLTGIAHPLPHVAETFERLRFRVVQRRATSTQDGETTSDEWLDALVPPTLEATIVAEGIDVVVVDPWAVYQGGAENSNDQAEAILGRLREITLRTGVTWVVLHHVGKGTDVREPEDLWRGASRLADWASTRITLMPHYSEAKRKQLQMERWEARRFVDVYFLRRSTPTPDFAMHLSPEGWWEEWEPSDDEEDEEKPMGGRPPKYVERDLVRVLEREGGSITTITHIAKLIGCAPSQATRLVNDAEAAGTVTVDRPGGKLPIVVTLQGSDWLQKIARSYIRNPMTTETRQEVSDIDESGSDQAFQMSETSLMSETPDIAPDQDICYDRNPPSLREGPPSGGGPPPVGVEDEPDDPRDELIKGLI